MHTASVGLGIRDVSGTVGKMGSSFTFGSPTMQHTLLIGGCS